MLRKPPEGRGGGALEPGVRKRYPPRDAGIQGVIPLGPEQPDSGGGLEESFRGSPGSALERRAGRLKHKLEIGLEFEFELEFKLEFEFKFERKLKLELKRALELELGLQA